MDTHYRFTDIQTVFRDIHDELIGIHDDFMKTQNIGHWHPSVDGCSSMGSRYPFMYYAGIRYPKGYIDGYSNGFLN